MTRGRALLFTFLAVVLAVLALTRLSFNVNPLDLLPTDLKEVKGLRSFMERFAGEGELLITIESKSGEAEKLAAAAGSLAELLESQPGLVSLVEWRPFWEVDQGDEGESDAPTEEGETEGEAAGGGLFAAAELPAYLWLNGEGEQLQALAARLAEGESVVAIEAALDELSFGLDGETMAFAGYDPFGLLRPPSLMAGGFGLGGGDGKFASADGLFRVLYVTAGGGTMNYKDAAAWIEQVRRVVDEWRAFEASHAKIEVGYTGEPAFAAEIGGGMQRDMTGSIIAATALIHLLFWLMHRRIVPLGAMFLSLSIILSATVILGSFVFGKLSVMSVGFAAILVGLAVDYGVVLYQEARVSPGNFVSLRRAVGPGILWAATTTVAVFASLGLSSLPGIRELGLLVALGLLVGAAFMLWCFGPLAASFGRHNPMRAPDLDSPSQGDDINSDRLPFWGSICLLVGAIGFLLTMGAPRFYTEFDVLRPERSPADDAFARLGERLASNDSSTLPMLIEAEDYAALGERAAEVAVDLDALKQNGVLDSSTFLPQLVPSVTRQSENRELIEAVFREEERLKGELDEHFSADAVGVLEGVFAGWRGMMAGVEAPAIPRSPAAAKMLAQAVSDRGDGVAALGLLRVAEGRWPELRDAFASHDGVYLTGWQTLGPAVRPLVIRDVRSVFVPMVGVLIVMLVLVFRNLRDVLLAAAVLGVSSLLLLASMRLAGWSWDFLNICAFPLLLGTGIDYTVHMVGALRRHDGDPRLIWRGIGRALVFCGISTAIGFGSLAFANNAGLASLGRVCAVGILITMVVTVVALPAWWRACARRG